MLVVPDNTSHFVHYLTDIKKEETEKRVFELIICCIDILFESFNQRILGSL